VLALKSFGIEMPLMAFNFHWINFDATGLCIPVIWKPLCRTGPRLGWKYSENRYGQEIHFAGGLSDVMQIATVNGLISQLIDEIVSSSCAPCNDKSVALTTGRKEGVIAIEDREH
jgi:hypothetical protein